MATWSGWENQLLSKAGLPTTADNRKFLDNWTDWDVSNCQNNPINLSHVNTGSFDCHRLTDTRTAQSYATHATAALAFQSEISSGNFPILFAQLNTGHPFSNADDNTTQVGAAELVAWGTPGLASKLADIYPPSSGGGGGGGAGGSTGIHKGWNDLRKSVNHNIPTSLNASAKMTNAALRKLQHARKVRL